ncbi:dicarboxylate/amino acid:cation symporter [Prolixibacteraceae bacterium JC049]|nr:dicarboxylate/amino acid:cation symporter [Prolixibacteraceae bacterium JC049]
MSKLKLALHYQILIALVVAFLFGYLAPDHVKYISWMGELFLKALKMVIVPLIFSSIASGITSMGNGGQLGRLGLKTFSYYLTTSIFAIVTGLIFVNLIQPGVGADLGLSQKVEGLATEQLTFQQTLMNIIPANIFEAMAKGQILPVIFFAILLGYFTTKLKNENKQTLTSLFDSFFDVMMKITHFIILFTPFGILGIVAKEVAHNADRLGTLGQSLLLYMATVILALVFHAAITLPIILRFIGKISPKKHLQHMITPLLTAFSTSSSSATLPLTMEAIEEKAGASNRITSFTLPLGATINMDGTALYECVAAMFIAQAYGIDLSFGQQMIVVATALLASIGAAGIPMAGLVMITVILSAVGLPLEGVGLILAVDRILDMMRTTTNVWSDSCGAVTIASSEGEKLDSSL